MLKFISGAIPSLQTARERLAQEINAVEESDKEKICAALDKNPKFQATLRMLPTLTTLLNILKKREELKSWLGLQFTQDQQREIIAN